MTDSDAPRTRLEQVLRQRHMTLGEFLRRYQQVTGTPLSERQAYRWIAGDLLGMPYPEAQAGLEQMFGEPVARLLGKPYGTGVALPVRRREIREVNRGSSRDDWQGQVISMSAERARDFLNRAEQSNVGSETIDQLADDLRRLAIAYQQEPLEILLDDLVATQDRAFGLLEGRQRPSQTRDLYLLAGVACGILAKASHDLAAPHDAMTQARAAYACAENAGHDGLRAWTRGLQALITYWSGQFQASKHYARQGAEIAPQNHSTSAVWLAASEARSLAALGRFDAARAAVEQATDIREHVELDELDELGGLCTFPQPRQLYYAADALAWAGESEAERTERLASEALEAYDQAPAVVRAFGDEAGTRCALGVARVLRGEIAGAAEAIAPVLELPPAKRIRGIVASVEHVQTALARLEAPSRRATELTDALHTFTTERPALPPRS